MWKWLHPFANPAWVFKQFNRLAPWVLITGLIAVVIGVVWGFWFTPPDCKQGEGFRIIYLHVPAAFLSMGLYLGMAIAAFVGSVWQHRISDYAVAAVAPVGASFTVIALATGAIWGKPMWGAWWVWDARLTSELILLFLYLGVIALYNAVPDRSRAGRIAGMLAMVGVINLPIIHYSVQWWNTLHQGATISKFEKPSMAAEMLWPLLFNIGAFSLLAVGLCLWAVATELLKRERQRSWARNYLGGER